MPTSSISLGSPTLPLIPFLVIHTSSPRRGGRGSSRPPFLQPLFLHPYPRSSLWNSTPMFFIPSARVTQRTNSLLLSSQIPKDIHFSSSTMVFSSLKADSVSQLTIVHPVRSFCSC